MSKIKQALVAVFIHLLFCVPAIAEVATKHGLLWALSKQGQETSYLFGTMHAEDERILAALDHVTPKVNEVQCLALELDLNPTVAALVLQAMVFNDGRQLKDVLDVDFFEQLVAVMQKEYGLGEMQLNAMKPWAVMMTLSAPKPKTGMFLDRALYLEAVKNNHRIVGLETPSEQISVMDDMSLSNQVALLETTLANFDQMPEMFEKLVDAYITQDLAKMEWLYEEYTKDNEVQIVKELTERLLNTRNELMAERMAGLLDEQACFVAVGALHLPGEQGLIKKMQQFGYSVKPVTIDFKL